MPFAENHLPPYTATDVLVTVEKNKSITSSGLGDLDAYTPMSPTRLSFNVRMSTFISIRGGIGLEKQRSIKKDYAVLYKALSMTSRAHTNEVILICRLRRQMHPSKHLHLPQQGNLRVF